MRSDLIRSIRTDFQAFVEKSFRELEGHRLRPQSYIGLLCKRLAALAPGDRHVINLPPRHLKTFIASICFPAWSLGRDPTMRILLLAGSEQLSEEIARKVHDLTRTDWFRKAFPDARLSRSKDKKTDFATAAGGEFFATSIMGNFTGRGGELIIIDDPLDIRDASNIAKIEQVNSIFEDVVVNRFNNPKKGMIVLIMHRLNDADLSAHVFEQGWTTHRPAADRPPHDPIRFGLQKSGCDTRASYSARTHSPPRQSRG